jgi:type I restriction enzyme M protein
MSNSENILIRLIDIIRKDAGINNSIDAMEQMSLILLLKYFENLLLEESFIHSDSNYTASLLNKLNVFFKSECFGKEFKTNFSTLKNLNASYISAYSLENKTLDRTWEKISYFLDVIPLKIRSEKVFSHLLNHLNNIDFYHPTLAENYEVLITQMVNESSASGEYWTPKPLVSAIVKVINPSLSNTIYDPALGTGSFFVETKRQHLERYEDIHNEPLLVSGWDISSFACLVGSLNLLLHRVDISQVSLGDGLLNDDPKSYDIVLSGIPFGKISNAEKYDYGYYGYTSSLEVMFIKHAMRKLAINGKAALIVPDGFLMNQTKEFEKLRYELLSSFNLHTILSLPQGALGPYAGAKVSVLFFENNMSESHIWYYELKSDKAFRKSNQVSELDFVDFVDSFSIRAESENSCLIDKRDILNKTNLSLALELPKKLNEANNFQVINEISLLDKEKKEFDILLSKYTDLILESKKVNFVEKVTLGDIFKTKAGQPLTKADIKEGGEYPVYGGNGKKGDYNKFNLDGESIIIGRVGAYCGNVYLINGPIWLTNNSFSVLLDTKIKVHLPYLSHVLRSLDLNKQARGSTQTSISYSSIKDIEITLPAYEQQVELSKWFEKVQSKNNSLLKSIKLQADKFSELCNYTIVSNCINKNNY